METKNVEILGRYISILYRAEQKYMNQVMSRYQLLPSNYIFIIYISNNEGINQRKLCNLLSLDSALATRAMTKLEEQGYVIREKNAQDGRAFQLYLSEKGKSIVPELKLALHQWWEDAMENVDEADLATVIKIFEKMVTSVEEPSKDKGKVLQL